MPSESTSTKDAVEGTTTGQCEKEVYVEVTGQD